MPNIEQYLSLSKGFLLKAKETQRDAINEMVKMVFETNQENGLVQLFGIGSADAFSMELGYRAGGLMAFHQFKIVDLALRGYISEEELKAGTFNERVEYVDMLFDIYNIHEKDMFIFSSYEGNQPIIVEAAKKAKEMGRKVIALVTKSLSDVAPIYHYSGKKLVDYADLVIDTGAPNPDMIMKLENGLEFNQVSSICANTIAQMFTAELYNYFKKMGVVAPVLMSANISGADKHNKALTDLYYERWDA